MDEAFRNPIQLVFENDNLRSYILSWLCGNNGLRAIHTHSKAILYRFDELNFVINDKHIYWPYLKNIGLKYPGLMCDGRCDCWHRYSTISWDECDNYQNIHLRNLAGSFDRCSREKYIYYHRNVFYYSIFCENVLAYNKFKHKFIDTLKYEDWYFIFEHQSMKFINQIIDDKHKFELYNVSILSQLKYESKYPFNFKLRHMGVLNEFDWFYVYIHNMPVCWGCMFDLVLGNEDAQLIMFLLGLVGIDKILKNEKKVKYMKNYKDFVSEKEINEYHDNHFKHIKNKINEMYDKDLRLILEEKFNIPHQNE